MYHHIQLSGGFNISHNDSIRTGEQATIQWVGKNGGY
jgi:hypothetical protein